RSRPPLTRAPGPKHERIAGHVLHEAIVRQPSVLLRVLELTAELSRGPTLEDHARFRRGQVPSRLGRQGAFEARPWCPGWRVWTRTVRCLVTVAAAHGIDAVAVHSATQPKEVVDVAVVALQRGISRRVAVLATGMHEDRICLHERLM